MTQERVPKFSQAIYERVSPLTQDFMRSVEQSLSRAAGTVEGVGHRFELDRSLVQKILHNMYIHAIFTSSMLKYYMLNASIVRAVNASDFLTYALAGRSLIEVTATLRYYLHAKIRPIVDATVRSGTVRHEQMSQLIDIEDRVLRGGRFDWMSFFLNRFDELRTQHVASREAKIKEPAPNSGRGPTQVNVMTCIEKWEKDSHYVGVLYELFCDMVHPNLGSTLCIATPADGAITFSIAQTQSTGVLLFDKSFPLLQSIAGKEFAKVVEAYVLLELPI
jgi:phage shock protein PspC (stress-responsive transcriptional regulator)